MAKGFKAMKRIAKSTVTDAIMEAMEMADEMESIIILYQNKPEAKVCNGFITSEDTKMETANFLVDQYKAMIFGSFDVGEEEEPDENEEEA